eukprot:scaffold86_cov338-Pavlova_lutheri.AAC.113
MPVSPPSSLSGRCPRIHADRLRQPTQPQETDGNVHAGDKIDPSRSNRKDQFRGTGPQLRSRLDPTPRPATLHRCPARNRSVFAL